MNNPNKEYVKYEDGEVVPLKGSTQIPEGNPSTIEGLRQKSTNLFSNLKSIDFSAIKNKKNWDRYKSSFNLSSFLQRLLSIFIIASIIIIYFVYIKNSDFQFNNTSPIQQIEQSTSPQPDDISPTPPDTKPNGVITDETTKLSLSQLTQTIDTSVAQFIGEEYLWIEKHFDNKINRPSLIKKLEGQYVKKENLYVLLYTNENSFKNHDAQFTVLEDRIINSIEMSKSIINAIEAYAPESEVKELLVVFLKKDDILSAQTSNFLNNLK